MSQAGSSHQGYPYVNPIVKDVPTLNPAEVATRANLPHQTWANLPRRHAAPREPVVYIDLPQGSSVSETQAQVPNTPTRSRTQPRPPKADPQQVVYIDIPDSNASNLLETRREEDGATFVQDTILYDPFKDRRIGLPGSDISSQGAPSRPVQRPTTPSTLEFANSGAGPSTSWSSGYQTNSQSSISQSNPQSLYQETSVYGHTNDGFSLSPLSINEFPRPPPAYEEVDSRRMTPMPMQPTEVIVSPWSPSANAPIIGLPDPDRKFVQCQHCRVNVHTMVLIQNGPVTHYFAAILFFTIFPLILFLYCTPWCNFFKYQNHYCPNCNKKIGHETPALCQGMVYVDTDPY